MTGDNNQATVIRLVAENVHSAEFVAELDLLVGFDWLHRGDLRSLFSERWRHESVCDLSPPASFSLQRSQETEMYFTTSLSDPETRQRLRAEECLLTGWSRRGDKGSEGSGRFHFAG